MLDSKIVEKVEIDKEYKKTKHSSLKSWSKEEKLNLIYIAQHHGIDAFLSTDFKPYFNKRNRNSFAKIYKRLKENKLKYHSLKKQVKLMKDLKVLINENNNPTSSSSLKNNNERWPKSKVVADNSNYWTHEECLYLVYGVENNGEDWENILNLYADHFNESRSSKHLKQKYITLKNDVPAFKFLLSEVNSLLK